MSAGYPDETVFGFITTYVPLTAAWTSVQGCSDSYMQEYSPSNGYRLVAFDPAYGVDVNSRVQCLPAAVSSWYNQGNAAGPNGENHVVTSIGPLNCPVDWSTVATSVIFTTSTQVLCCPPRYSLSVINSGDTRLNGYCVSTVGFRSIIPYASYSDGYTFPSATTTLESASTVLAIPIEGWNIGLATASSSSSSSPSGGDNGNGEQNNGLSTGAKAGIGAGVGVAVLAIIGLVVWIFVLKRKNKRVPAEGKEVSTNMQQHPSDPYSRHNPDDPSELVSKSLQRPAGETKVTSGNVQQYPTQQYNHYEPPNPNSNELAAASMQRPLADTKDIYASGQQYSSEQYGRYEPQSPNSSELAATSTQRHFAEPYHPSELTGSSMQRPAAELPSRVPSELPTR